MTSQKSTYVLALIVFPCSLLLLIAHPGHGIMHLSDFFCMFRFHVLVKYISHENLMDCYSCFLLSVFLYSSWVFFSFCRVINEV